MQKIINADRSIIPACDVNKDRYEEIIRETCEIPQVGAYKISAALAVSVGLSTLVEIAKRYTKKPLIYDHQKAGTDIPDTGEEFTAVVKDAGIDALIIFPLAGPATQEAWIKSAQKVNLPVIIGGYMTHDRYLSSEGGYIEDTAIDKMYSNAAFQRVNHYVVPGNKPKVIERIRSLLLNNGIEPIFYAPGFISQGGSISEAAHVAGPQWHAIVGRAIYDALNIRRAAESLIKNL